MSDVDKVTTAGDSWHSFCSSLSETMSLGVGMLWRPPFAKA